MTEMFETNMTYLKHHKPSIYKEIEQYLDAQESDSSFTLITDNVLNIQYRTAEDEFLLFSKYDPNYECERWLQSYQISQNNDSDFVIYGLGLTYHLSPIIEQFPDVKLFIYEPEVGIFIEALKVIDAESLFTHKNIVHISVGKSEEILKEYTNYLYYYAKFPIRVLDVPIYRSIDAKYFVTFLKVLERVNVNKLFKNGFHQHFGNQMFINSLRNIPKMCKTPSFDIFKKKFEGSTAIIVGAGPSLQYDIEYIKQHRDDCLIIAAGSSVQSLVHLGVIPHLVVSMDPGIHNSYVFTRNNFNDIPLLYMPQIHHEIVEIHSQNNVFAYYHNDVIVNMYVNLKSKDYAFDSTFSVTGTAIQAAVYIGAKNIVFTGQDLSYPGKVVYSPGAIHTNSNINTKSDEDLTEEVPNVLGGKNPTTFSMKKTLENIEQIIALFPKNKFINTSSKGAVIKGTEYMELSNVFKYYSGRKYNFDHIKMLISEEQKEFHPDFLHVRNKTIEITNALSEFINIAGAVLKDLKKLLHYSDINEIKAEQMLRKIENKWGPVVNHYVFKEVVSEWMVLELNEYDQNILNISTELDVRKKAVLLDKTLGSFSQKMIEIVKVMQEEFNIMMQNISSDINID
ncbi:motility associated factor glycosyltransferase family protein [Paenibacillus sp. GXUN7292]|uniref:motility associated factor glycosyltransferase family protein n=1 Tax=Paenibacillus sp. GXUN7292 TaxID=3422499 RepID=UPI003D7E0530